MTRNKEAAGMILLIHGRGPKPPLLTLEELWLEALHWGVGRWSPASLSKLKSVPQKLVYYGDLANDFLDEAGTEIAERRAILEFLKTADYDTFAGATSYGIEEPPADIEAYWDRETEFSKAVTTRLREQLVLEQRSLILAHSMGALLAVEHLPAGPNTLVTMGSPLTHPHVQQHSPEKPRGVERWVDIRAQGDLICGPTPSGDEHLEVINPVIRADGPDPHHALGYLAHPVLARLVGKWLSEVL